MLGRSAPKVLLLLGFLLPASVLTTPTPDHLNAIRARGTSGSSPEDFVGGGDGGRDTSEAGVRIRGGQQKNLSPSRVYRTLSRRSIGRYVLATSSLVGECARVYAPEPLGLIASSLCSRFATAWDSKGRDRRASLGHQKSSAFSYDKFMSNDPTADDEDPVGGGDPSSLAVPPKKYGRVSSAFLTRHEIGGLTTNGSPTESGGAEEKTHTAVPRGEELDARSRTPSPSMADAPSRRPSTAGNIRAFGQQAKAGSVFKSLAGLGWDKTSGGG
ncbi:unnamed protein product, partial [Ectocarpus sp. 12 AP-2014]